MDAGAEEKGEERRGGPREFEGADGGVVDVAQEERVHGAVPIARELVPGRAVPPIGVEATVGKAGEFGEDVELEGQVVRLGLDDGRRAGVNFGA